MPGYHIDCRITCSQKPVERKQETLLVHCKYTLPVLRYPPQRKKGDKGFLSFRDLVFFNSLRFETITDKMAKTSPHMVHKHVMDIVNYTIWDRSLYM